ncbi:hypothetical protein VE03_10386 [Pseudogymnoascus sp. 23342-1-I1]|nr:hypothetical protein VE03_10386 [Pseudogymnoascus sp. 23342-1-I1]
MLRLQRRSQSTCEQSTVWEKRQKKSEGMQHTRASFYYLYKAGKEFVLPVAVGDVVVQLRTSAKMEETGRQWQYEVLWTLGDSCHLRKRFRSALVFFVEEEDSKSALRRQTLWDSMLATRIRLNFLYRSKAESRVDIQTV